MNLSLTGVCDIGCVRGNNEDMVLIGNTFLRDDRLHLDLRLDKQGPPFLVAVADGMGGAKAGEIASQFVLEQLRTRLGSLTTGLDAQHLTAEILAICVETHRGLLAEADDPDKSGMGSTLIGLLFVGGNMLMINAGDSRLYRFRDGTLTQLSRDHSLRQVSGVAEAPSNIVVNSFGGGTSFYVDIEAAGKKILNDDVFLLCSDGISDCLSDVEIEQILAQPGYEHALLEAAKRNGGHDNISYVLAVIGDAPES